MTLTQQGGSYDGKAEQFLQSTGDLGLAPTALAVHPLTGDLYVSVGGRGTRGAVYRISYPAGERTEYVTAELPKRSLEWNKDLEHDLWEEFASKNDFRRRRALVLARRYSSRWPELINTEFALSIGRADRAVRRAAVSLSPTGGNFGYFTVSRPRVTLAYRRLTQGEANDSDGEAFGPGGYATCDEERLDLLRGIQQYFGDIGSSDSKGTVFEGYSPRDRSMSIRSSWPGH